MVLTAKNNKIGKIAGAFLAEIVPDIPISGEI